MLNYIFTSMKYMSYAIYEGELKWIPKDEILKLNLWQGDILFLKRLLKDESYFEMKLTYIKDDLKDWSYL